MKADAHAKFVASVREALEQHEQGLTTGIEFANRLFTITWDRLEPAQHAGHPEHAQVAADAYAAGCDPIVAQVQATGELPG